MFRQVTVVPTAMVNEVGLKAKPLLPIITSTSFELALVAVGLGAALAKMLVSLPLLDSSPLGFHARAHSNLVSLLHPGLLERTGVAGPADGGRGPGVCAAGQLLSLGERLGPRAATAECAVASKVGEPAGFGR